MLLPDAQASDYTKNARSRGSPPLGFSTMRGEEPKGLKYGISEPGKARMENFLPGTGDICPVDGKRQKRGEQGGHVLSSGLIEKLRDWLPDCSLRSAGFPKRVNARLSGASVMRSRSCGFRAQ